MQRFSVLLMKYIRCTHTQAHLRCPLDELCSEMSQWEIFKKYRNWLYFFLLAERMTNEHAFCKTCCVLPIALFSLSPPHLVCPFTFGDQFTPSRICPKGALYEHEHSHMNNSSTAKPYVNKRTDTHTQNESDLVGIVYCCMSYT